MDVPPAQVLDKAAEMVQRALASSGLAGRSCLGLGVAAQGAVDVDAGVMKFAPRMPGWVNVPIRDHLAGALKMQVLLEHDPQCLAYAERWFGAATSTQDVVCILLSEGIGMGMLLGGEIFRGSEHMAGEFGHMTVQPDDGLPCACGDTGCIESYCSVQAVLDAVGRHPTKGPNLQPLFDSGQTPTIEQVIEAARRHDPAALAAFGQMGKYLGIGIANTVDMLNPSLVVLCGVLTAAYEFYQPAMDEQLQKHAWKHSAHRTVVSTLGPRALTIGACGIVLQKLLETNGE